MSTIQHSPRPRIAAGALPMNGALPLNGAQAGIVHAELADPDAVDFGVGDAVVFRGALDAGLLARAIDATVAEVPWLGHRVEVGADGNGGDDGGTATDGTARLVPAAPVPGIEVLEHPAAPADAAGLEDFIGRVRERFVPRIRLGEPLLFRQVLLASAPAPDGTRTAVWVVAAHHVLTDAYGIVLLVRRATEHYAAAASGTDPGPSPFTAPEPVLEEEARYAASTAHTRDRDHWATLLEPNTADPAHRPGRFLPLLGAAGARPDPAAPRRLGLTGRALELGRYAPGREAVPGKGPRPTGPRATWADAVVAAHALVLTRLTGAGRAVIGLPVMNRLGSAAALCPAPVVNVLPLVVEVGPADTAADLVSRVAAARTRLVRHGRYRAEQLSRDLHLVGSGETLTATEVNIKAFDQHLTVPGGTVEFHALFEGPVDDIALNVLPVPGRDAVRFTLTAPGAEVSAQDAAAVLAAVEHAFESLAAAEDATPLARLGLTGTEDTVLHGGVPAEEHPPTLEELFAAAVAAAPDAPALRTAEEALDYRALDARAAAIASAVAAHGSTAGRFVAIDLPRGADYVAAILAAARAGATSVPLDPQAPPARNRGIVERLDGLGGQPAVVLATDPARWPANPVATPADWNLPAAGAAAPVSFALAPRATAAYLVHTSGSTGEPKAVAVSRDAFAHWMSYHRHAGFHGAVGERIAQTLPLHFDGAWCTLMGIALGHEIHLFSHEEARDPDALAAAVAGRRLTWLDMTPSMMAPLLDTGLFAPGHGVRRVSVGGEGCPQPLWERLRALEGVSVENLYGPTEFTVDALVADARASADVAVGRPLPGLTAVVLDAALRPLPAGLPGELYLAGPQEAHGYLGRPAGTAARFIANPFAEGGRMYRTGDRAVLGHDGLLRFLGRDDGQVKVRGYRIDVGEVETALVRLPGIAHAVVRVRGTRLLGWVVPANDAGAALAADPAAWRAALGELLPAQMVPHALAVLPALPLGSTGKLDEAALPEPSQPGAGQGSVLEGPAQHAVAAAMAAALGTPGSALGPDADFFAEGGDSITAIALVSRLRRAGWSGSVGAVFARRTVAGIAEDATPLPAAEGTGTDGSGPSPASGPAATPAPPVQLVQLDAADRNRLESMLGRRRGARR
ncbi:non-ribosomal peptide synthetase [Arthrobacter ginkgonis]|uniref:Non-ribosomal peptide synthetase n=1 Tax=Arthrobacter ginkgonis TaxID=1630594 RepID=A0ABP7CE69_9MICC